jgi:hypothetical protein
MAASRSVKRIELDMQLNELYGCSLDGLTKDDAGHFIKLFQDNKSA